MSKVTSSLTEVMVVVYFPAPLNLNVLDLASWADEFREFNLPQQTPSAPPLQLGGMAMPQVMLAEVGPILPRLILRSDSTPFALQFQPDRFGVSWARKDALGKDVDYPGFEMVLETFTKYLKKLDEWYLQKFGSSLPISILELAYINALPPEKANGEMRRLSELFKFVVPDPGRRFSGFNVNWMESLVQGQELPRVFAQAGIGLAAQAASVVPVMFFNFTGHGRLEPNASVNDPSIGDVANLLHDRILDMYRSSIVTG